MRHIKKGTNPPRCLQLAQGTQWSNFRYKQEITDFLLEEQHCLCAYCENKLERIGKHIEHVMPKSRFPDKTFDYYNLVLSCLNSDDFKKYPSYLINAVVVMPVAKGIASNLIRPNLYRH